VSKQKIIAAPEDVMKEIIDHYTLERKAELHSLLTASLKTDAEEKKEIGDRAAQILKNINGNK